MITPELIAKFRIALDYIDALGLHGRHVGDLINHAPALLEEIERLREENARLNRCFDRQQEIANEAQTELAKARARVAELEAAKKTCRWHETNTDEYPGVYTTECGHMFSFDEGARAENDATYCQYCGGLIVEASK